MLKTKIKKIVQISLLMIILGVNFLTFAQEKPSKAVKILFIGNSYTYQNNLPKILSEIAATANQPIKIQTRLLSQGGFTLMSHWQKGEAVKAIHSEKWDYVVLQEQSTLGMLYINGYSSINDPTKFFFPYSRMFDKEIKAAGAKTVFMMTWAPKSQPDHQPYLTYAYMKIAKELNALVVPVGTVWEEAGKMKVDPDLYDSDGNHPSPKGSYLAATLFYSTLFDKKSTGAVSNIQGHIINNDGSEDQSKTVELAVLSREDAEWMQNLSWSSHQNLKKNGGYLKGTTPKPITLPTLPVGLASPNEKFLGIWKGKLNFYAVDYNLTPANFELSIRQTPDGLAGTLALDFPDKSQNITFQLKTIEIRNNTLFFSTPPKKYDNHDVFYQGVLTKNGLEGIARNDNEKTGGVGIGTWSSHR